MKTIGPTEWNIFNGHNYLGYMEVRVDVGPEDSLKRAFDSFDRQIRARIPVIVLSPHTEPKKVDLSNALR